MMDEAIRMHVRDAVKRTTVTRNRSCHEQGGCKTFTVKPIRLDDEADAVINAVLRSLSKYGYRLEKAVS